MNRTGNEIAGYNLPVKPEKPAHDWQPNISQMRVWWEQLGVKVTSKQVEHFLAAFSLKVDK